MKKLMKSRDKKVSGVAGGVAHYFDLDPTIGRAIFLAGAFFFPPTIILYFVLSAVLPESDQEWEVIDPTPDYDDGRGTRTKRLLRSRGAVVAGVAAGLAQYLGIDVTIVRVLFVIGLFAGFGFLLYLILWACVPKESHAY